MVKTFEDRMVEVVDEVWGRHVTELGIETYDVAPDVLLAIRGKCKEIVALIEYNDMLNGEGEE